MPCAHLHPKTGKRSKQLGEALISTLDQKGVPSIVERVLMAPPCSKLGPVEAAERERIIHRSPLKGIYDESVDRESAYEMLGKREEELSRQREEQLKSEEKQNENSRTSRVNSRGRQGIGEALAKSVARSIGSSLGRQIIRGILGSILGGRR